jgi:hypothetical protein
MKRLKAFTYMDDYDEEETDNDNCCDNPDIKSSTYTDWCENCGWSYSYL